MHHDAHNKLGVLYKLTSGYYTTAVKIADADEDHFVFEKNDFETIFMMHFQSGEYSFEN